MREAKPLSRPSRLVVGVLAVLGAFTVVTWIIGFVLHLVTMALVIVAIALVAVWAIFSRARD